MDGADTLALEEKLQARHRRLRALAAAIALVVAAIALITLIGWLAHVPPLLIDSPGSGPMKLGSSMAMLAAAVALWIRARGWPGAAWQRLGTVMAGVAALIGALAVIEHAFGLKSRIDLWFTREALMPASVWPGTMSLGAAVSASALGIALAILDLPRCRPAAHVLAGLGAIAPYFALLAIAFSTATPGIEDPYVSMSAAAALCLGLLSLGTLLARTDGPVLREVVNFTPAIGAALALLVVLLGVVGWNWWLARDDRARDAQAAFAYETTALRMRLLARFTRNEVVLTSGRALLDSSNEVTRDEWHRFVQTLRIERTLPGVLGLGFAPRIAAADLPAHVASVRKDGFPTFRVWPEGARGQYGPIMYLEPFPDFNLRAIGFDMFSEPVRRSAMVRAMDTGNVALSERVRLVQEVGQDPQPGFLMYAPAYRNRLPTRTVEQRRAAHIGWVYSPYRAGDFMRATLIDEVPRVAMEVYDGPVARPEALLYRPPGAAFTRRAQFRAREVVVIGGRSWTLGFVSTPAFEATRDLRTPAYILYGGTAISVLLCAMALSLITARRRAQALADRKTRELRSTNEQLVRQTRDLERSNAELEQFAYVASHDLREPLRTVTSFTQLLEDEYGQGLPAEARRYMGYIVEGNRRMRMLIDDLLSLSRVGTGTALRDRASSEEAVRDAMQALAQAIEETSVQIEFHDLPPVIGDRVQLVQLFQNLLGNALKFRSAQRPRVTISATRDEDWWQFAVADNGIGIDRKYFDRIFVIFQRLHGRGEYAGNGIGLAICRKIVERHGGLIWVESQVGSGATFYFTLRAAPFAGRGESLPAGSPI